MADLKTQIVISLVNKITEPLKRIEAGLLGLKKVEARLKPMSDALGNVSNKAGAVGTELAKLGATFGALGGGSLWLFKTQFIDTAAKFERFKTILETVEGSSAKAQKSMDWVSDFAARTPYELDQVMEAFVKLRAYGMDPTKGMLETLGNTAAAMGKPLMMAIEAIADAVTGENERLKEFGIKAQTKGNFTRYEYSDKEGKTRFKTVNNKSREQIRDALTGIWDERYSGAMDKLSRTYQGMMSNVLDQWTRFKMMVMQNGAFDFIKSKLEMILATADRMASSGELKRLAEAWGEKLFAGAVTGWKIMVGLGKHMLSFLDTVKKVADAVGGFDNLLAIVFGARLLKTVAVMVSFGSSLVNAATVGIPLLITGINSLIPALTAASVASAPLAVVIGGIMAAAGLGYGLGTLIEKNFIKGGIGEWAYDVAHGGTSTPTGSAFGPNGKLMGSPQNTINVTLNVDKDGRLLAESKDPNTRVDARGDFGGAVTAWGY